MTERRGFRHVAPVALALIGALAILFGVATTWREFTRGPAPAGAPPHKDTVATLLVPPLDVPAFALADDHGRPFDAASLRGRWTLLFFGYTHCPDICPTTLKLLARAQASLRDLPEPQRPRVVFVSVDPARDTPTVLAQYVAYFGTDIIGVTGAEAHLEALTRPLGIAYRREAPLPGSKDYTMAHSSSILYVDPLGRVRALASPPHTVETIAGDFRKIVAMPEPAS
jgi:protein SCO1/2